MGGGVLGKATKMLGPAAVGASVLSHLGTHQIDDPEVDSSAAGTWRALREEGPAGLFTEGSKTRMSLGKGLHEAVADVGGFVAGAADAVLPGTPATDRLNNSLRSAYGGQMASPPPPKAPSAPQAAAPQAAPPSPAAAPAAAAPANPSLRDPDPGAVTRVGNTYSGGNVSGGITINGQAPGGGTVSAQNMAAADALAARDTLRGSAYQTTSRPAMPVAQHSDNSWQARNNLRNLEVSAKSITNDPRWGGEGSRSPEVQAYMRALDADNALRGGFDAGSVARTNAQAAMYGDDVRSDAARYTSDNSLRGTMATAGASRAASDARLRYDMGKDARDYKLRLDEAGLKRRDSDRAARASEQDAVSKRLETMFRTNQDGKDVADTAKIGEYTRAVQATLGDQIKQLTATGTPAALAKAEELRTRGLAALDDEDHTMLKRLFDTREVSRKSAGISPFAGRHTESDNLLNYRQHSKAPYDEGLLQTQVQTAGGSSIPVNSLRNKTWYGGGTENLDLVQGLRLPR